MALADGAIPSGDEPMPLVDDDDIQAHIPDLPDLAIYKILTLLPPSSVTRFKVVCKSWLSMIADPSFVRHHAEQETRRGASPSILLFDGAARFPAMVVDEHGNARLALQPWRAEPREGYSVQNCCGSVACLRNGQGGAELLNPATGACLRLGKDHDHDHDRNTMTGAEHLPWYCLGRCPSTGEYKVVRLDLRLPYDDSAPLTLEVCALGRGDEGFSRQWQEVGRWGVIYCPTDRGVHIDGVVYYRIELVYYSVFCIDLFTYDWRHIDLPMAMIKMINGMVALLSELDGRLCASLVPSGDASCSGGVKMTMDVWVLTGVDGQRVGDHRPLWVHRYRFELDGSAWHVPRPLFFRGGRMVMKYADGSLCHYDVEAGSGIDGEVMVFEQKSSRWMSVVTADVFVENLLPLHTILRA